MRDSFGVPYRRVQQLIRFGRDEVMGWAKRRSQGAKVPGIEAKTDTAHKVQSLRQALASLPA